MVTLLVYLPGNSSNNNLIKICYRQEYMHEENWLQFDVQIIRLSYFFGWNIWCKNTVECPHHLHTALHTSKHHMSHLELRVYHNYARGKIILNLNPGQTVRKWFINELIQYLNYNNTLHQVYSNRADKSKIYFIVSIKHTNKKTCLDM